MIWKNLHSNPLLFFGPLQARRLLDLTKWEFTLFCMQDKTYRRISDFLNSIRLILLLCSHSTSLPSFLYFFSISDTQMYSFNPLGSSSEDFCHGKYFLFYFPLKILEDSLSVDWADCPGLVFFRTEISEIYNKTILILEIYFFGPKATSQCFKRIQVPMYQTMNIYYIWYFYIWCGNKCRV